MWIWKDIERERERERERETDTLASSLPRSLTGVPERGDVRCEVESSSAPSIFPGHHDPFLLLTHTIDPALHPPAPDPSLSISLSLSLSLSRCLCLAQPPAKKKWMIRSLVYPGDPIRDIRVRVRDSIQFRFGDFSSFFFFFFLFFFFFSLF